MRSWVLALVVAITWPAPARADSDDAIVAILPFTANDSELAIYSKAGATALASELRGLAGVKIQPLLSDEIPTDVSIVVSARMVQSSPGKVKIELTVRDPEFGVTVATVSTKVAPLSEIDQLVSSVGGRLQREIKRALAGQRRRLAERNRPIKARPTYVRGEGGGPPPEPADDGDRRARMIVLLATGQVAGGAVEVRGVATEAGFRLSERLGYRPLAASNNDVASHADAGALAKQQGAVGALKLQVKSVRFDWVGVLTARGKVRVLLTGPDGKVLFDETVKTDTVVGSRGDRHAAVVRMVLDQAMDIAAPPIRKRLSR